jgi:hypothetical protein
VRNTARRALAKRLEMLRAGFSSSDEDALRTRLAAIGRAPIEAYLRSSSWVGLNIAKAANRTELKAKLTEFDSPDELLTRYTAVAWAARALVFAELLERFDPDLPEKWAAQSALTWLSDFESEEVWLWPFESPPPWPDDDDENEEDFD